MKRKIKTFGSDFLEYCGIFLAVSAIICYFPYLLSRLSSNFLGISFTQESGFVGDTIGGTMGPFVGLIAAALTFLAFWVQYIANKQQRLDLKHQIRRGNIEKVEQIFFEMIKIHRDNVMAMRYDKQDTKDASPHLDRRVPIIIFREFIDCINDIGFFFQSVEVDKYLLPEYENTLKEVIFNNKIHASIKDLVKIDIAYSIIYFGVGKEGLMSLRHNFSQKYHTSFFDPILAFLSMKPKKKLVEQYKAWENLTLEVNKKNVNPQKKLLPFLDNKINKIAGKNPANNEFDKFYGGHQHRLGHYFRHLFQTYKFLDSRKELTKNQKYSLAKILRAQISTYEQALILINSISSLGMRWEFVPKKPIKKNQKHSNGKLITTYQVIKNLPGIHLYDIKFDDFYPNIEYEFSNK